MSLIIRAVAAVNRVTRLLNEDLLRIAAILSDHHGRQPALAITSSTTSEISGLTSDPLAWDGILFAGGLGGAPKHKPGFERRRKKKQNLFRFNRFIRSWHMLVPCDSCGGLRKKYHLCETCYNQTRFETQQVREKLKEAGLDLNKETVIKYKDDNGRFKVGREEQVFLMDRKRPAGWFSEGFWGR